MTATPPPFRYEPEQPPRRRWLPELVLAAITMIWGGTFLATQIGLSQAGPMMFVGLRFAAGAVVLGLLSVPTLRQGFRPGEFGASLGVGMVMIGVFGLQSAGLTVIASSKSAFLTALYVPLVPIFELMLFRRLPRPMVWVGVAIAFVGLVLLAGPRQALELHIGHGELLTLGGAVAAAVQIILMGRFAAIVDPRRSAVVQLATVAIGCLALAILTGEAWPRPTWTLLASAGGLGLASAFIQVAMTWGQRSVAPTRATLIYAGEPVWAGLVGRVAGERLPAVALAGAAMVVCAVVVSEVRLPRWRRGAAASRSMALSDADL